MLRTQCFHPKRCETFMIALTLTLALTAGAGDPTPYGLQPPVYPFDSPPAIATTSPYGVIPYFEPAVNTPRVMSGTPRMLPAVPVVRPIPAPRASTPPPITLPDG